MEDKNKLYYTKRFITMSFAAAMAVSPLGTAITPVYATESVEVNQIETEETSETEETLEVRPVEGGETSEAEEAETNEDGTPSSIADLINEQKNVLSDAAVYQVRIGYEFDDGSFDEWARGTGYLVSENFLLTSQTLTDTSTKSNLFAKIQASRADMYAKVGISLSDQATTEAHLKVYVTDISGKKIKIGKTVYKNGMGIITLKDATSNSYCVFANDGKADFAEGEKVNLKFAGTDDDICSVQTGVGEVFIPEDTQGSSAFYFTSDTTNGNPLGAPVYDANGNIIGMVSSVGDNDELTALSANALETFLTSNGVTYKTLAQVQEEQKAAEEAQALKDAQAAGEAIVNTDSLEEVLEAAETLSSKDYTKNSYASLDEAVKEGKEILEDSAKTQAQVDAATENINLAMEGLKKASLINQIVEFVSNNLTMVIYGVGGIIGAVIIFLTVSKSLKKGGKKKKVSETQTGDDKSELLRELEAEDMGSMNDDFDEEVNEKFDNDSEETELEEDILEEGYRHLSKSEYIEKTINDIRNKSSVLDEESYDAFEEDIEDDFSVNLDKAPEVKKGLEARKGPEVKKDKFSGMPGISGAPKKPAATFGDGFDDEDEFEMDEDVDVTTRVQPKSAAIPTGKKVPGLVYGDEEFEDVEDLSDDGSDDTTVLKPISAYLIRVETGKRIPITKNNFLIGKERKKVNYCIANNGSVSRIHARIFQDANGFCIEDQKSTNYTYVNNQQVPAYTPIRLVDGTPFRLSDVEFEFHVGE